MDKSKLKIIAKKAFEVFIENRKLILSYYDMPSDFKIAWEKAIEESIESWLSLSNPTKD